MYKIAVLGDRESVMGFKALGLDVITAETVEEATPRPPRHGQGSRITPLSISPNSSPLKCPTRWPSIRTRLTPAVILIPGKAGSLGIGMKNITSSVERAVGADIL